MGNVQTAAILKKVNEKIQRHIVMINKKELTTKDEPFTCQLSETHTFYSEIGKFYLFEKIFIKTPVKAEMSKQVKNFKIINESINITTYPYFVVPKYKYEDDLPILTRQYLHTTLEEKLQSGIQLSDHQKAYISVQIILAVNFLHEIGLYHGNLDVSNILMTTDNTVYLTDFAPYKPVFLDEADFDKVKLLYPHILERCYLAPETFDKSFENAYAETQDLSDLDPELLTKAQNMDIFALGCILNQIYTDGKPAMAYKDLLAFKDGNFNPYEKLEKMVADQNLAETIKKMMSLNPLDRGAVKSHISYFENFFGEIFFKILMAINYALRRSEFSHPDIKLGLIRLLSGYISGIAENLVEEEASKEICRNLEFKSYFPYQISMVVILYNFKAIYQNSPLLRIMECEGLIEYLDEEIKRIEQKEVQVKNSQTSTVLEKIKSLEDTKFNYNANRENTHHSEEDDYEEILDFEPNVILKKKFDEAQTQKKWQEENFKLNSFGILLDLILTCTRNLQIDQSFRMAIELISQYSKLVWNEHILEFVIPFVSSFVVKNKRSSEAILSMRLFCKMIKRIKFIPKSLANLSVFSVYIKPLRNYCFESTHNMLRMLIAKNLNIFVELSLLFEILNKARILQTKNKEVSLVGEENFNSEEITAQIIEYFKIDSTHKIFSHQNEIGDMILKLAKHGKILTNFSYNFKFIEGYLRMRDVRNLLSHICETLTESNQENIKIECLRTIPGLIRRLDRRDVSKLNRIVLKVLDTTANPSTLYNCLLNLAAFVENFKEDKILSARIIQKTLVLILHPCLRVRNAEGKLIENILNNSSEEEILAYYAPILRTYTKNNVLVDSYEFFRLAKFNPVNYTEYKNIERVSTGKGGSVNNLSQACQNFLNDFLMTKKSEKKKKNVEKKFKKSERFKKVSKIRNKIQEVLAYTMIYGFIEPNEGLEKLALENIPGSKYLEEISNACINSFGISVFPKWNISERNYKDIINLMRDYGRINSKRGRLDSNFNKEVFRLVMNELMLKFQQLDFNLLNDNGFNLDVEIAPGKLRNWNPSGILLSSINEHTAKVNTLVNLQNNLFASGSSDGTVKLHSIAKIKRNFTHKSESTIDFRGILKKDNVEVNKLEYIPDLDKMVAFSNTKVVSIMDVIKNKNSRNYYTGESEIKTGNIQEFSFAKNCIGLLTNDSKFIIVDPRVAKFVQSSDLNKVRGVPSGIASLKNTSINLVGTHKGYLISHDLRANSCTNMRRLVLDDKQIPILSVKQFVPQSNFRNVKRSDELVTLTYPSNSSEFSIFCTNDFPSKMVPRIHFCSTRKETRTSIPHLIPHLEDVTNSELYIDYDTQCQGKYSLFSDWKLDENSIFKLGNSFEVRNVDSIVNLYDQPFHHNIIKVKHNWIKNFETAMKTLSSLSDFKNTVYKILNYPESNYYGNEFQLDNIILTGGTDRNLRFLNLGNPLTPINSRSASMSKEYGDLECFHLSNTDNVPRRYKYVYSGNSLIIKEELASSEEKFGVIVDPNTEHKNLANGLSFYHNSFLYKKKNAHTLPGHTAAIRDLITVENEGDILVISAGDDHSIKIWN